ncbi:MAG: sugar phosphate isomerase/epimerase, partial [Phycisphaerae bacterium]|nr:sugar phosphate isomerase/epimerase [Phycisphaerae bacterium]
MGGTLSHDISRRLAVCQWSLQADTPGDLAALLKRIGINRIQLGLDWFHLHQPWKDAGLILAEEGIEVASGMFMAVGEDYSTLESIRRTGGIVPDETWPKSWENFQKIVPIAGRLQLGLVTFHAGFLPEDESDPAYERLLDRLRQMAELSRSV